MTIGTNIKKLRTTAGLTQDQLAERLYVTRQTVSNWERGISRPDLDQLEANLRMGRPAIVGRINHDRFLLDVRTLKESDYTDIVKAVGEAEK